MIAMDNGTRHEVKTNLIFLGIGFSKRFNWAYICFAGHVRGFYCSGFTTVDTAAKEHPHGACTKRMHTRVHTRAQYCKQARSPEFLISV